MGMMARSAWMGGDKNLGWAGRLIELLADGLRVLAARAQGASRMAQGR